MLISPPVASWAINICGLIRLDTIGAVAFLAENFGDVSASFRVPMICSSVKLDFRLQSSCRRRGCSGLSD
jgi:hypothetical protein